MSTIIKKFKDNSLLEYDSGKFDQWCIYLTRPRQNRYAPRDPEYFNFLLNLSCSYTPNKIYDDFLEIYGFTNNSLDKTILNDITKKSISYGKYALDFDIWLTTIYAGMVAEENKAFTKLGKRIKHLGIYQVLFENVSPKSAANFSRGKGWQELDLLCRDRGF